MGSFLHLRPFLRLCRCVATYGRRPASHAMQLMVDRSGLRRPFVMMTRAVVKPSASAGAVARPVCLMIRGRQPVLGNGARFITEQAPIRSLAFRTRGFATATTSPSSEALLLSPRNKKQKIFREIEALGESGDVEGLLELASSRSKDLTPANACHLLNRLARLGSTDAMRSDERFRSFVAYVYGKIEEDPHFFRPQQVRDIGHAIAKLDPESSHALGALIVEYVRRRGLQEFDPEAIGDVFSALAKLGYEVGDEFKREVTDDLRRRGPHGFDPKTIARNAKALADQSSHALERLRGENWSEKTLSSVVDGLKYVVPPLIEGLPPDAVPRAELSKLGPRDIANILTAFVKFGHHPGEAFMAEVMKDVRRRGVHQFDLMDLLKLVHALAKLGHHPGEDLLENVVNHLQQNGLVEGYNYVQAEKLARAFGKLGYSPGERLFE